MLQSDVTECDPATWLQNAGDLTKDGGFVRGKIDDAVRDDAIHRLIRQGNLVDCGVDKIHIGISTLLGVLPRALDHRRGHIDTDSAASRANHLGSKEYIESSSGAKIDHDLSRSQVSGGCGIAAGESHVGARWNRSQLFGAVAKRLRNGLYSSMVVR